MRDRQKRRADELGRERAAQPQRNPAVFLAPQDEDRRLDPVEPPCESGELELPEHAAERGAVDGLGNGRVVLVYVRVGDLVGVCEGGLEQPFHEPAPTEGDC
jgi:hypothetical protein